MIFVFLYKDIYLEMEMAPHSSIPVWIIPRAEEPGQLESMRLQRAGQDLVTNINLLIFGDKLRAKFFFSQLMDRDLTVDIVKKSSPS